MKKFTIVKKMLFLIGCISLLAGCSAKERSPHIQEPIVSEDGTVSLKNLYFSNGKDTVTDLSGNKVYEKFKHMIADSSNMGGTIDGQDILSFEVDSRNTNEMAFASFTDNKQLFQITISPNYSDTETEGTSELTLSGVKLQNTYDEVISIFGEPTEITKNDDGSISSVSYNETDTSFVYIGFKDEKVSYIAVQFTPADN